MGLTAKAGRAFRYGNTLLHPPDAASSAGDLRRSIVLAVIAAAAYGGVMGSYGVIEGGSAWQIVYSAIKTPLLLGATFAITLPSFMVINTLLGLRHDLPEALLAIATSQAVVAIALVSLAPVTLLWYLSVRDYHLAILFNAFIFALASAAGQRALRRRYVPLIRRHVAHGRLLKTWIGVYAFVGIQSGWVMRPFIGRLEMPAEFLRPSKWDNAYVIVAKMIWQQLHG